MISLILVTIFAGFVNGALGHGFSSITVPIGLLYYSNRVLNPALVLVEIGANFYTIWSNRTQVLQVWKRVLPFLMGLFPAILLGSLLLKSIETTWIRLLSYCVLAPLILLQGFGVRKPIKLRTSLGVGLGSVVGLLYSITTISGPPLAIMLNNEGFQGKEFKAALGIIRFVESSFTAFIYYSLGFFFSESLEIFLWIVPGVLLAMPLGSFLFDKIDAIAFRRICISVDAWFIAFGLFRTLLGGAWLPEIVTYLIFFLIVAIDAFNGAKFLKTYRRKNALLQTISS
jgi:uncharacterized membrane protein YfcA